MFLKIGLSSLALLLIANYVGSSPMSEVAEMFVKYSVDFVHNGTQCKTEVGASDEDVSMLMKRKIPKTKTGFCMLGCMFEKMEMLKDGVFMHENAVNMIKMVLGDEDPLGDFMISLCEGCAKKATTKMDNCGATQRMLECRADYLKKFTASVKAE